MRLAAAQIGDQLHAVLLGLLLGEAWTTQVSQRKLRRQAEERRRLNKEWPAVREIRQQQSVCECCGDPLPNPDIVTDFPLLRADAL